MTELPDAIANQPQKSRFSIGTVHATPGTMQAGSPDYRMQCLARHMAGDWGCCDDEDKTTNDDAVLLGNRILSSYPIDPALPCKGWGDNTLWIITEADRSNTTLLLPDEY